MNGFNAVFCPCFSSVYKCSFQFLVSSHHKFSDSCTGTTAYEMHKVYGL